jgi:hypothetical protein
VTAIPVAPTVPIAAPITLDPSGCLAEDISCRKCGYNLRGLSPNGRCPECGTAVGRSLQGDYLHFADPQWVRTLASGMDWLVAALLLGIIVGAAVRGITGGPSGETLWTECAQLLASLISFVGYWKLTTPDPVGLEDPSKITARKLTRITQLAGLATAVAAILVPKSWSVLPVIVAAFVIVIAIVGMFATLTYARQLALRIPDERMAGHCRIVMWGIVACMGLGFILGLAMAIVGPGAAFGACFVALGFLVFGIWSLVLIFRFRRAFKESAHLAAATWAAAPRAV